MGHLRDVEIASSIRDALQEVVAALEDGASPDEALADAAKETGLNPKLIERKFVEQHGMVPADYLDMKTKREAAQATNAEGRVKDAVAEAHAWSKEFVYAASNRDRIGRLFSIEGEQYALVAIVNGASYPIKAVAVKNKKRMGLKGSTTMKAVVTALKGA